jgi:hypothetical protein
MDAYIAKPVKLEEIFGAYSFSPPSLLFLAGGGLSLFLRWAAVFSDSGSIADHRAHRRSVRHLRESLTDLARVTRCASSDHERRLRAGAGS